jgi:hypothetical protein
MSDEINQSLKGQEVEIMSITEYLKSNGYGGKFYAAGEGVIAFSTATHRDQAAVSLGDAVAEKFRTPAGFALRIKISIAKKLSYKGRSFAK